MDAFPEKRDCTNAKQTTTSTVHLDSDGGGHIWREDCKHIQPI